MPRARSTLLRSLAAASDVESSSQSSWNTGSNGSSSAGKKRARRTGTASDEELRAAAAAGSAKAARQLRNRESARKSRMAKENEIEHLRQENATIRAEYVPSCQALSLLNLPGPFALAALPAALPHTPTAPSLCSPFTTRLEEARSELEAALARIAELEGDCGTTKRARVPEAAVTPVAAVHSMSSAATYGDLMTISTHSQASVNAAQTLVDLSGLFGGLTA